MLFTLLVVVVAAVMSACATSTPSPEATEAATAAPTEAPQATAAPTEAPPDDLLNEIKTRGTLVIATDPAYPPQSELAPGGSRAADTKCTSDQHTASEFQGFDIDASVEVAKRLGVEACFTTPNWDLITVGNWSGRWDISIGSMTPLPERVKVLYFSQPYYTVPAQFYIHKDNTTFTKVEDLSGKKVGSCKDCTYDKYLMGTLELFAQAVDFKVKDAVLTGYGTDIEAAEDLKLGDGVRLDAVLTSQTAGEGWIKDGYPIKALGDPVFFEYNAAAVDKSSPKDSKSLIDEVTRIIQEMHKDGVLKASAEKWFGVDIASPAASFDPAQFNK
jgi:polar amino acid transport system substrate-binding protein